MTVRRSGFGVALSAAIAAAGCGGGVPGSGAASSSSALAGRSAGRASTGDLLYVIHASGAGGKRHGVVTMLTFPGGQRVGDLSGTGAPSGVCSAPYGNVWVVGYSGGRSHAYEFPHGDTEPIAQIDLPKRAAGGGCAVDPGSGDLAIQDDHTALRGAMLVYHGTSGKPVTHRTDFEPLFSTYDGSGDLLADGIVGSTSFFSFAELPRNGRHFKAIDLDQPTGFPGGLQWDGRYVALQTGEDAHSRIYRLESSPNRVRTVQTVHLLHGFPGIPIAIDDNTVVGLGGRNGTMLDEWPYPEGGHSSGTLGRFHDVRGLAISKGSEATTRAVP